MKCKDDKVNSIEEAQIGPDTLCWHNYIGSQKNARIVGKHSETILSTPAFGLRVCLI